MDISTFPGLDPYFRPIRGRTEVAERLVRRLISPLGSLYYDTHFGEDIRDYLSKGFTPQTMFVLKSKIERQCESDDAVFQASANITVNQADKSLRIQLLIVDRDENQWTMLLAIDQTSAEILRIQ